MNAPIPVEPRSRSALASRWAPLLGLAALAFVLAATLDAGADDEPAPEAPAKLEKHPLADAKPGEYLRYVESSPNGWKKWFIERVLGVREGEILFEVYQTNDDGSKDLAPAFKNGWIKTPEFKAQEWQRFIKDEMVVLEVNGQKLNCRHLLIEEPLEPPLPDPKVRREVWYSNDVPCSGKVKESRNNREIISWGMMPQEEVDRRRAPYDKREKGGEGGGDGNGSGDGGGDGKGG